MTTLEGTFAKALTEIAVRLDVSDDDAITPEATMEILGPMIALLQDLPEKDRQVLAELINQCAQEDTGPERHLAAWEAPKTLGLLV